MKADIERQYGPFAETDQVHGVTFDGSYVWFAAGDRLQSFDPETGDAGRAIPASADAGTAFDGKNFYQLVADQIHKIDAETGRVVRTIFAPGAGRDSGLAWAEGTLWVGQYRERKIHQINPDTGELLRTIESNRFVTGVTWVDGELWHGTWEGDQSELRQVDPSSGEVITRLSLPAGVGVTGLESDGERFYCGGGSSGKVRSVRKPKRASKRGT